MRAALARMAAAAFTASCVLALGARPMAQRPPAVDVVPLIEADGVHAGSPVKLALRVSLPGGVHVQSDKPRDPMLIPTRVTLDAVAGVTLSEVVYPAAIDFVQPGQSQPLAVFEQQFAIGMAVTIAKDIAPGALAVPVHLRYQACDAATCYAPVRFDGHFALTIVSPGQPVKPLESLLFRQLRFSVR